MAVDTSCWVRLDGLVEPPKCQPASGFVGKAVLAAPGFMDTVTHNLGTEDLVVQAWHIADENGNSVPTELSVSQITIAGPNTIEFRGGREGTYRVVVIPVENC